MAVQIHSASAIGSVARISVRPHAACRESAGSPLQHLQRLTKWFCTTRSNDPWHRPLIQFHGRLHVLPTGFPQLLGFVEKFSGEVGLGYEEEDEEEFNEGPAV